MSTAQLTTTSYVVLGMIALRGPSTSYDLKRGVNHSVGYFWPFPHAQLYSEPKRLVDLGLLKVAVEAQGRRKQTFSVTNEGLSELRSWLADRTTEQMQVRDVAQLKLFFGELAGSTGDVLALAKEQTAQHEDRIAVYEGMQTRFGDRDDVSDRMVPLELGLELERAALGFWQRLVEKRSTY